MQALIHPLTELADYEEIVKNKERDPERSGSWDA